MKFNKENSMEKVCKKCNHWERVDTKMGRCKAMNEALTPEIRRVNEDPDSTIINCDKFIPKITNFRRTSTVFGIIKLLLSGNIYKFKINNRTIIVRDKETSIGKELAVSEVMRVYCDDGTNRFDIHRSTITIEDLMKEALSLTLPEMEAIDFKVKNLDENTSYTTRPDQVLEVMLIDRFVEEDKRWNRKKEK